MTITAYSTVTGKVEPVYGANQALNVNMAGQATQAGGQAAVPLQTTDGNLTPIGYRQYTSTGSAFNLGIIPAGARIALIRPEAQAMRWRDDGVAPTATVGMPLNAGDTLNYNGNLSAVQFIASTAGAILNVVYYS